MAKSLKAILLGDPVDPEHQVVAQELYDYLVEQMVISGLSGTTYFRDTLADLVAVSGEVAGDLGIVLNDGTEANNGMYSTDGSTWTKVADLPDGFSGIGSQEKLDTELAARSLADNVLLGRAPGGRRRGARGPAVIDQFDRAHAAFDEDGFMIVAGVDVRPDVETSGRRRARGTDVVVDAAGTTLMAAMIDGVMRFYGIDLLGEYPKSGRRRQYHETIFQDRLGLALMQVRDGQIYIPDMHPDTPVAARLPVTALRGDQGIPDPFNVGYVGAALVAATVQEPMAGQVFDVVQRRAGSMPIALISQSSALRVVWTYGQSNAGNYCGSDFSTVYDVARWKHTVAMFAGGPFWNENTFPSGFTDDLTQATDDTLVAEDIGWNQGQSLSVGLALALEYRSRVEGDYTYGLFATGSMKGGERLENLQSDSAVYANMLTAAAALPGTIGLYDRSGIGTIDFVFVQGESITVNDINGDPVDTSGTAQASADAWVVLANALFDDVLVDLPAQTGCNEVRLWMVQTNRNIEGASEAYANSQLQLALDRADLTMAGAMVMCPLSDEIHPTPEGKLLLDDTIAHIIRRVDEGETWVPLMMDEASATVVGSDVTIPIVGGPADGTLMKDTDWQPAVDGDGFVVSDSGGVITVSTVTYQNSPRQIVLGLGAVPSGTVTVKHAIENTPLIAQSGATPGWPRGRTRVCVQTARLNFYAAEGASIPQFERHYLSRQTITI